MKRTRAWSGGFAALCCSLVLIGCEDEGDARRAEVPRMKTTLELSGSGLDNPTVFTYEQLAGMPMARLDNILMRKSYEDDEITSWEGPPLAALLTAARIKSGPMKLALRAQDGYQLEATLEDMKDAIIALKDGQGRWLARVDRDCEWKLVPPHKPANFWIMNLSRITVEPAGTGEP